MSNNLHQIADNQFTLIEAAEKARHLLKSTKAAFRLLEGAMLTGIIEAQTSEKIISEITTNDGLQNNVQFKEHLYEFLEGVSSSIFKEDTDKKYKSLKAGFSKLNGKKIMLVDDQYLDTGWKQVFNALFGDDNVSAASNAKSTLQILKKYHQNIVCIFIDLKLPDEEQQGIDLIKEICVLYPHLPVVAFSATDSVIYAKQAFVAGALDYFPKDPGEVNSVHRNPIYYFLHFNEIIKRIFDYEKTYVVSFWSKIIDIENKFLKYDKEHGSGLALTTVRELKKAYKHLVFEDMNSFVPAFLESSYYDEVIYCCSKAFECRLGLYSIEKGIHKESILRIKSDLSGSEKTEKDILEKLKGLAELINNMRKKNDILNLPKTWFDEAEEIRKIRNRFIHGYFVGGSSKSSKLKSSDKATASKVLSKTINLIHTLID